MILVRIYKYLIARFDKMFERYMVQQFGFDRSVRLYNPRETVIKGNIRIGRDSYINSGRLMTGPDSTITIGHSCAIGHNVTISSITHDLNSPVGVNRKHVESDIIIGDCVWIGTNVFIKQGVSIGDKCIIGANSVVVEDCNAGEIIGGVPARVIRSEKPK